MTGRTWGRSSGSLRNKRWFWQLQCRLNSLWKPFWHWPIRSEAAPRPAAASARSRGCDLFWRAAEPREISPGKDVDHTDPAAPTLSPRQIKNKHTLLLLRVNGRMDFFSFFFFFAVQFISFLLALPFCRCARAAAEEEEEEEEGRLSATRDSNEISQTLHHVGFLMIILHFVDNQQNVLNQGPALDQVCVITWPTLICALLKWRHVPLFLLQSTRRIRLSVKHYSIISSHLWRWYDEDREERDTYLQLKGDFFLKCFIIF